MIHKCTDMFRFRKQKFFMTIVILFPSIIFLRLKYQNSLPWCENIYEYPIKGDLRNITFGNKLYRGNKEIKPINVQKFKYIYHPAKSCPASKTHILCVVKSAPERSKTREAIRKTWGKVVVDSGNTLIFSLGENKDSSNDIHREAIRYGDILQGDFEDTYYNVTLKTMMGIQWISNFCPSAPFVFLVDDDVMVNFHNLLTFTTSISDNEMSNLFSGFAHIRSSPMRKRNKWFISKNDFPFPCYPTYLSGAAIVISAQVIKAFNAAIPYVKFLAFDDVFLGIVAWKLGIQPRLENSKFDPSGNYIDLLPCIITSHVQRMSGKDYQNNYNNLIHQPCIKGPWRVFKNIFVE